jgi:exodeoxyribonuclease VII large subunit
MNDPVLAARVGNLPEFTVSEISGAIKRTLEGEFGRVRVRGEITELKKYPSGHIYFSLKDEGAKLSGIVWKNSVGRLGLKPENGVEVIATGRISAYGERSSYQLIVERMEYAGAGALLARIEMLRVRLAAEGLFDADRKIPLPVLPRVIGVVTSERGAVIQDIRTTLARRFPRDLLLWPVAVQGEGAAEQIAAAIAGFDALPPDGKVRRPDVLIVARGGGSLEDLMAFNEEIVLRAVAACRIPLISAVGHETDTTLIDFVSDRRAPTPTAAAEMAVPVRAELMLDVEGFGRRALSCWWRNQEARRNEVRSAARALPGADEVLAVPRQRVDHAAAALARALRANAHIHRVSFSRIGGRLSAHLLRTHVERRRERYAGIAHRLRASAAANIEMHRTRIARDRDRVGAFAARAGRAIDSLLDARWARCERDSQLLAAFSYRGVLARGFTLVRDRAGRPVRIAAAVTTGTPLDIEFSDGHVGARAEVVQTSSAPRAEPPRRRRRGGTDPGQGNLF